MSGEGKFWGSRMETNQEQWTMSLYKGLDESEQKSCAWKFCHEENVSRLTRTTCDRFEIARKERDRWNVRRKNHYRRLTLTEAKRGTNASQLEKKSVALKNKSRRLNSHDFPFCLRCACYSSRNKWISPNTNATDNWEGGISWTAAIGRHRWFTWPPAIQSKETTTQRGQFIFARYINRI